MDDYKTRVKEEKEELEEKIYKLEVFVHTCPVYKELCPEEAGLLSDQLEAMQDYAINLNCRIDFWADQEHAQHQPK